MNARISNKIAMHVEFHALSIYILNTYLLYTLLYGYYRRWTHSVFGTYSDRLEWNVGLPAKYCCHSIHPSSMLASSHSILSNALIEMPQLDLVLNGGFLVNPSHWKYIISKKTKSPNLSKSTTVMRPSSSMCLHVERIIGCDRNAQPKWWTEMHRCRAVLYEHVVPTSKVFGPVCIL